MFHKCTFFQLFPSSPPLEMSKQDLSKDRLGLAAFAASIPPLEGSGLRLGQDGGSCAVLLRAGQPLKGKQYPALSTSCPQLYIVTHHSICPAWHRIVVVSVYEVNDSHGNY